MTEQTFTPWDLEQAFEIQDDTPGEQLLHEMATKGILTAPMRTHTPCDGKHLFGYNALHILTNDQYAYEFACKKCRKTVMVDTYLYWQGAH